MLRSGRKEGAGWSVCVCVCVWWGDHGEISRNMCDSFPSSPFFTAQFGHPSNKTISEYGNPGPGLPPRHPPCLLCLCSWPRQERRPSLFSPWWSLWGGGEAPATPALIYEVKVPQETEAGLSHCHRALSLLDRWSHAPTCHSDVHPVISGQNIAMATGKNSPQMIV